MLIFIKNASLKRVDALYHNRKFQSDTEITIYVVQMRHLFEIYLHTFVPLPCTIERLSLICMYIVIANINTQRTCSEQQQRCVIFSYSFLKCILYRWNFIKYISLLIRCICTNRTLVWFNLYSLTHFLTQLSTYIRGVVLSIITTTAT